MIAKKLIVSILISFVAINVWAADYYMANNPSSGNAGWSNGSDSNNGLAKSTPFLTLQYAMAQMSAGDTLIIDDGTYTGSVNSITDSNYPPISSTVWTTIQADNDGAVVFNGENARQMIRVSLAGARANYIFRGLIWGNSNGTVFTTTQCTHIKVIDCGGYNAGSGNTQVFSVTSGSSYVLLEGCYAWGSGRAQFTTYGSDALPSSYNIFRNCVSRIDRVSASDPTYNFGLYSVNNSLIQNCIAIDTDQSAYYDTGGSDWGGGLGIPSTTRDSDDNQILSSVVLNSHIGGTSTTENNFTTNDNLISNCVVWDIQMEGAPNSNLCPARGTNNILDHCTYGDGDIKTSGYGINGYTDNTSITNCIITDFFGGLSVTYDLTHDYGAYYNNGTPFSNTPIGVNSHTNIDPIWNASTNTDGALKYITRIESGSSLSGIGSASSDIGANLVYLIGTPETIYGEVGYNTVTATLMWPFPNEDLIKTKMASYEYDDGSGGDPEITGARGFCATTANPRTDTGYVTLTSYIWEYLGNTGMTATLYSATPADAPTVTITSPTTGGSTTDATITVSGTSTHDSELNNTGVSVNGVAATSSDSFATWSASGVSLSLGANTITATVTQSDAQTGTDSISYTRTSPPVSGATTRASYSTGYKR